MLQIINQITEQLLKGLPSESNSYTLEELRKAGIPLFLVEKIHIDLLRNLADSISVPGTEWANLESERVKAAWQTFIVTIEAEVLLPKGYMRPVIEGAVEDVVDQLVTPRQKLIEMIFRAEDSVDINSIRERSREFVVYPYLGRALPRYLERKNQSAIDRNRAGIILSKVDERVTGHYTPLNWAQLLEPWFDLMGEEIDTDLVRRFFEEKGLEKNTAAFESAPGTVNRAHFIELLSMGPITTEPVDEEPDEEIMPDDGSIDEVETEQAETQDSDSVDDAPKQSQEDEIVFTLTRNDKHVAGEHREETDKQPTIDTRDEKEERSDMSISEKFKEQKEGDDLPIWQKFLSAEEGEENEGNEENGENTFYNSLIQKDKQTGKEEKTTLAEVFLNKEKQDEPEGHQPERADHESNKIRELLKDHEQSFIDNLFHGSVEDYVEAVKRLDNINNWREASGYLYREVFKHHGVSLYSDEAIEFTDRLQHWYQKKSQN